MEEVDKLWTRFIFPVVVHTKDLVEYGIKVHENASLMCTHCHTWQFAHVGILMGPALCSRERGFSFLNLGSQCSKYSTLQQGLIG